MPEWQKPRRGYYLTRYRGKLLEIVRNPNPTDTRRYVAKIDGIACAQACHTLPLAKKKAIRLADKSDLVEAPKEPSANGAIVPYVEPEPLSAPPTSDMMFFQITGHIPTNRFGRVVDHLQTAVDMLREEGALAECEFDPPRKVKL
jgi:hypothetical protein